MNDRSENFVFGSLLGVFMMFGILVIVAAMHQSNKLKERCEAAGGIYEYGHTNYRRQSYSDLCLRKDAVIEQ